MAVAANARLFAFDLRGITPLLMHADDVDASATLDAWRKDPANKNLSVNGDDRSPAWTWMTYAYKDSDGMVCMPADNVMVCLRAAGAKMILKRQTTFKAISQSGLLITDESLEFTNGGRRVSMSDLSSVKDEDFATHRAAVAKAGFELLCKRAVIGTKKHVRVRPMFRSWTVRGTIQVLAPEITEDNLALMFSLAGSIGLGDWRPGCKTPGRFGMFESVVRKAK